MGYGRGESFPLILNQMEFNLVQKVKRKTVTTRSYPNQFERKWNTSFLSVRETEVPRTAVVLQDV